MPSAAQQPDQKNTSESADSGTATNNPPFGELIKFWRSALNYSQQELAAKLETTPRHISFLETGRSQPLAEMVSRLANALELDESGHNTLMSAAGLMVNLGPIDLALDEHRALRKQLSLPLAYHDPFPALMVDQLGDIALFNKSWLRMLSVGGPLSLNLPLNSNLLDMYFATAGIRQHILEWEQFACVALLRAKEQQILTGNQRIGKLIEWLEAYEGVPENWALRARKDYKRSNSNYKFALQIDDINLSWHVVVLGAEPMRSNAASNLLLHQFFPANEETRVLFESDGLKQTPGDSEDDEFDFRTYSNLCDYSSPQG